MEFSDEIMDQISVCFLIKLATTINEKENIIFELISCPFDPDEDNFCGKRFPAVIDFRKFEKAPYPTEFYDPFVYAVCTSLLHIFSWACSDS